jgi:hypothetical protein
VSASRYRDLEGAERPPRCVADHTRKWATFTSLSSVDGQAKARLERFCEQKQISIQGLGALGARVAIRKGGRVELAYAGFNGEGRVIAIKFRPLDGSSHESHAEEPSNWLRPIVVGRRDSLDWLVAEGETDGARLFGLVGDRAAILVLPAGALTFKREWAALIPRGATVALCHDADEDGDAGAEKAAAILGGRTLRVRPPIEGGDWCEWEGGREEFLELLRAQREPERPFSLALAEFVALERPQVQPLILDADGRTIIARNSLTLLGALGGHGKTTFFVELALHGAAGRDYLCFRIPEPFSTLLIENEGPEDEFARKLREKLATFPYELRAKVRVHTLDWGALSLADPTALERLREDVAEHEYDLVFGDPLDSLGIEGVGSPEDTRRFLELLKQSGLHTNVAWWLNTHPRKEETKEALNEISGAWGGKPDAVLLLKLLAGDRSQLRFPKLRWAKRGTRPTILLGFDPESESFTYLAEEEEERREYRAEIVALLGDGGWRTVREIGCPKKDGGAGINYDIAKAELEGAPEIFESRTGEAAKALGRSSNATVWQLRGVSQPGGDTRDTRAPEGEGGAGVSRVSVSIETRDPATPHLTRAEPSQSPETPTLFEVESAPARPRLMDGPEVWR